MVGRNAAELELPHTYSQLHPVFNVSLLMPYVGIDKQPPPVPNASQPDVLNQFVDWASMSYVLNYRCLTPDTHEYLLCGQDPTPLDDEWRLLTTLSPHLDLFWQCFHQVSPAQGRGPLNSVWNQRSACVV